MGRKGRGRRGLAVEAPVAHGMGSNRGGRRLRGAEIG